MQYVHTKQIDKLMVGESAYNMYTQNKLMVGESAYNMYTQNKLMVGESACKLQYVHTKTTNNGRREGI